MIITTLEISPKAWHVLVDGKVVGQYYPVTNNMCLTQRVSEATEKQIVRVLRAEKRDGCFDEPPALFRPPILPDHIREAIESDQS